MAIIKLNSLACRKKSAHANGNASRQGIIVPLFAITLPVLLILCAIALNIAHFRMLRTELKIAADASAHAAGRALSVYQDVDQTIAFAKQIAAMNNVGYRPYVLPDSQIVFGRSTRPNAASRYSFTGYSTASVRNRINRPNSVAINAAGSFPVLLTAIGGHKNIQLAEQSIATQTDRDIVLVLDKSGSMLYYKNDAALDAALFDLYRLGRITRTEYYNAKDSNSFSLNVANRLTGDMQQFAQDRRASSTVAPRHSRYAQLKAGVSAFFDVVEATDQEEFVALVTFSSSATLNNTLRSDYTALKTTVNSIYPNGATAIGLGMQAAAPELFTSTRARPYATKTIVVLTDGANTTSPDPVTVAQNLKNQYNVTIHTVTFSVGAEITPMEQVASIGGGRHFHTDDGAELPTIFRTIANNLPTLLTK